MYEICKLTHAGFWQQRLSLQNESAQELSTSVGVVCSLRKNEDFLFHFQLAEKLGELREFVTNWHFSRCVLHLPSLLFAKLAFSSQEETKTNKQTTLKLQGVCVRKLLTCCRCLQYVKTCVTVFSVFGCQGWRFIGKMKCVCAKVHPCCVMNYLVLILRLPVLRAPTLHLTNW